MDVVQFIEHNFLADKHLTKPTINLLHSMANAYGSDSMIHLLDTHYAFLKQKEYDNQKHFESTILLLFRQNAAYMKRSYATYKGELNYNIQAEPPEIDTNETTRKKVRQWIV